MSHELLSYELRVGGWNGLIELGLGHPVDAHDPAGLVSRALEGASAATIFVKAGGN